MTASAPSWGVDPESGNLVLRFADVAVDLIMRRADRAGRALLLRGKEFDLLLYMIWHHGRVLGRAELFERIWSLRFHPGTNRLEVQISRLRATIDRDFPTPLIHTVEGQGYRLAVEP